jgi:hypothetical protein
MKPSLLAVALAGAAALAVVPVHAKTLNFGGHTWTVRSGGGGPGPNSWDANNVWLDSSGALHLKITHAATGWTCAELYTSDRIGFGTYQWFVTGQIDQLDDNIVLGLFNYPTADVGPDSTNEIDIEFSRWGVASYPNGNYTVWPVLNALPSASRTFNFSLNGNQTTQRFDWQSTSIAFESLYGFTTDSANDFGHWTYAPKQPGKHIGQKPMPLHMNLWLYNGQPPKNGQEVEIVINAFKYMP